MTKLTNDNIDDLPPPKVAVIARCVPITGAVEHDGDRVEKIIIEEGDDVRIKFDGDRLRFEDMSEPPEEASGPVDGNGEALEVGDVVDYTLAEEECIAIIGNIICDDGKWIALTADGHGRDYTHRWKKLHSLTPEQYVPLARRTVDGDMTDRERFAEHSLGLIEEIKELRRNPCANEAGDVLWYVEMVLDVIEKMGGYQKVDTLPQWWSSDWIGIVKKAALHGRQEYIDVIGSAATTAGGEVLEWCEFKGWDPGEVRLENIQKLYRRYPDGFESGGGKR